jgi:hypothetical protein
MGLVSVIQYLYMFGILLHVNHDLESVHLAWILGSYSAIQLCPRISIYETCNGLYCRYDKTASIKSTLLIFSVFRIVFSTLQCRNKVFGMHTTLEIYVTYV